MKLAKDQLIRIIKDAGKIPVERDVFYSPLHIYDEKVLGRIPYLNSLPFYENLEGHGYKTLPVPPRRMGMLCREGQIAAGLFSLMDYLRQAGTLELFDWCIASRDQVKSVMLFSKEGWAGLDGRTIGIADGTATSVVLLQILLEKKYGVNARFMRLHGGVNEFSACDAVLLIGDEALHRNKSGLDGFELVFDLAREWYEWQKLPCVFAVWAAQGSLPSGEKEALKEMIAGSLNRFDEGHSSQSLLHGRRLGLTDAETREYLQGFNYRLGEREREAIGRFADLAADLAPVFPGEPGILLDAPERKTR